MPGACQTIWSLSVPELERMAYVGSDDSTFDVSGAMTVVQTAPAPSSVRWLSAKSADGVGRRFMDALADRRMGVHRRHDVADGCAHLDQRRRFGAEFRDGGPDCLNADDRAAIDGGNDAREPVVARKCAGAAVAFKDALPTATATPARAASSGDSPTERSSGSVKQTAGTAK
jgi:hypothetical protein